MKRTYGVGFPHDFYTGRAWRGHVAERIAAIGLLRINARAEQKL